MDAKGLISCIALRTMVTKDGVAYLQAGGGIVFGRFSHSLRAVVLCHPSLTDVRQILWRRTNMSKMFDIAFSRGSWM